MFNKTIIPKEVKFVYCLERIEHSSEALNVKNTKTVRKAARDIWHVEDVVKKTQNTWSKIVLTKPNPQTTENHTSF